MSTVNLTSSTFERTVRGNDIVLVDVRAQIAAQQPAL